MSIQRTSSRDRHPLGAARGPVGTGGHDVTAVACRPEQVAPRSHLVTRAGDALDAASLRESCRDADAVVICIGPRSNLGPGTVMSVGTAHMVAAAQGAGGRRFVFRSGIGLSDGAELSRANRWVPAALWRPLFVAAIGYKAEGERPLRASALDWVIVHPVALRNAPAAGHFLAGPRAPAALLSALSFCRLCRLPAA